jgi:hypothetical protein
MFLRFHPNPPGGGIESAASIDCLEQRIGHDDR